MYKVSNGNDLHQYKTAVQNKYETLKNKRHSVNVTNADTKRTYKKPNEELLFDIQTTHIYTENQKSCTTLFLHNFMNNLNYCYF